MSAVEIVAVRSAAELRRFIRVPAQLFAADPHFVPPLELERKDALTKKNPYFEHAEAQYFIAVRGGRDVGRISAQIDHLLADQSIGQFGLLAAIDDAEVFAALFAAAESWLKAKGKTRAQGPFNLSINEETGLLIDGFDAPPMIFMSHDPRYAGARVEQQGYAKAKDLIAYLYDIEHDLPPAARRLIDRRKPAAMTVRNLDTSRYDADFETARQIFNDAWSENWGFVPFTEHEFQHLAKGLKPIIDPTWMAFVEMNGEPIGFGVTLPNLNEAIRDFGGKLLPFNWLKLLLRLKRGTLTGRVPLMGVRRSFSGGLLAGLVPFLIIDTMHKGVRPRGVKKVELSWILEDNKPMRHIIEALGSDAYKTYRVYEKTLT